MAFGKKNQVKLDILSYNTMLIGESKVGKEQPISEPVLTKNGWLPMGDIKVGMSVYGEDGQLHKVTGVYPQGVKDVYEVTFSDRTKTRCGLEHLWTVATPKQRANMRIHNDYRFKVLTLKDIMKDYRRTNIHFIEKRQGKYKYKYSIPINQAINFEIYDDSKLKIDPYILGLLLGDGGFTCNSITFTNAEDELFNSLSEWCNEHGLAIHSRNFENHKQANICIDDGSSKNYLKESLKELNLLGCGSREKFIPKEYLYSSINNRQKLLSGIINTDGNIGGSCTSFTVSTYSKQMSKDIAELSRSLGYISSVSAYDRTSNDSSKKYEKEIEYRVSIISRDYSGLSLSKKHLSRLKDASNIRPYVKSITNIEKIGKEECQCIMVDNPNHLYITNNYIVTHNTTLIKEVCEKLAGEDGYLFMEISSERGADAISNINYINCPEWNMDYDDYSNSAGFADVCEDIIENKTTEYPNLKVVVWDTYDHLIEIAEKESIRLWNKECREKNHPEKAAKTINQAWSGFGKGEKMAISLMLDMMARLRAVGVSTIVIGHVKTKEIDDAVSGESYRILTSDQQQNYFNAIKKNLHFLGLAYINRTIAKEKTGKKNIVTNKDEVVGKIKGESRKIKFRDDSYAVDSGSRFAEIVPEIDMNADAFIEALENAILAEQKKSGVSVAKAKATQAKADQAKAKQVAEAEKAHKSQKELDIAIGEIVDFFTNNKTNLEIIKPILAKCKEMGYSNPKEISDLDDAKTILAMTLK